MTTYRGLSFCLLLLILGVSSSSVTQGQNLNDALQYLKSNSNTLGLTATDLDGVVLADQSYSKHSGVTHLYVQQYADGVPVHNGLITISFTRGGDVVHVGNRFVSDLRKKIRASTQALSPEDAALAAAAGLDLKPGKPLLVEERKGRTPHDVVLSDGGFSLEGIPAELVYLPLENGEVRLAWNVGIYTDDAQHYWSVFVDAGSGVILRQDDLVVQDNWGTPFEGFVSRITPMVPLAETYAAPALTGESYKVYAAPIESPSHAGDPTMDLRTLETDPADPTASPLGWHNDGSTTYATTQGNNVHAYLDLDANNIPDPGSSPAGPVFDFPVDFSMDPSTYEDAAVTNLFYWNNVVHDIAFHYGFDEVSGNFQAHNLTPMGKDGDYVRAEAQDGSGLNNANFFTPRDGFRPRMQMFKWTAPRIVTVNTGPAAGTYPAGGAVFGPPLDAVGVTGIVELGDDGTGAPNDGCEPLIGFTPGNIALIDRGACRFDLKVTNAQNAGAIGAIVANNRPGPPITMGGGGPITIPSVFITQSDGAIFKANLPLEATLRAQEVDRDSDFDNGIIVHEYAHGISNRLTGGPMQAACLRNLEQPGEGWSDYYALMLTDNNTDNRGIATYVTFQPTSGPGIRPALYSTDMGINPFTYGDVITGAGITLSIPHGIGSVWANMIWEMTRSLVDRYGFDPDVTGGSGGNNLALQLVTDGLKMQTCSPGFVDARDAILAADVALTDGANECLIWDAFAKRGLGLSADQGSSDGFPFDGSEAFDVPEASCCTIATLEGISINHGLENAMLQKLDAAEAKIRRGQLHTAINILNAFINSVNALVGDGVLTPEEGAELIACAEGVINRLQEEIGAARASGKRIADSAPAAAGVALPTTFAIEQNYPNPFNPRTQIQYALPERTHVRLSVYDVLGREVMRLVDEEMAAGFHEVGFNASRIPSGVYFYRIDAGSFVQVMQMTVVK